MCQLTVQCALCRGSRYWVGFCQLDKNWIYLRRRKQTEKMQKSRRAQGSHTSNQQRLSVPTSPQLQEISTASPCHPSFRGSHCSKLTPSAGSEAPCPPSPPLQAVRHSAPYPEIRHNIPQHHRDPRSRYTAHALWVQRCFCTQKA